jgi:hypothetical protein
VWNGPVVYEASTVSDVNDDGHYDTLSVSADGHLVANISNGSIVVAQVDMPNVFCAGIGDCLIGDVNGDGNPDLIEVMRGAINLDRAGDVWVSLGSPVPGFPPLPAPPAATDTDGDGIADRDDVCIETVDPAQLDSDGDGYGDACDADLDQDGIVGQSDLAAWLACWQAGLAARPECVIADFDGDGVLSMSDYRSLQAAMDAPPGPSAIDTAPVVTLAAPADGTILNATTSQAWVAGWVANVPEGDVAVTVNGVPTALNGPDNFFSTFIDMSTRPTEPSLFHAILVEAVRGEQRAVERRVVMAGKTVKPGFRAHGALGARLSSEGLGRIESYLQTAVAQKIQDELPGHVDGIRYIADCSAYLPICWSSITIRNTQVSLPQISVEFVGDTIHAHAHIDSLTFNWEVEVDGPNCGEDTTVSGIDIDLQYRIEVAPGGDIEVHEVHEPVIDASIDVDGCWGGGHGAIEDGVRDGLRGYVNDPDDIEGTTYRGGQTGAAGKAIQDILRKLEVDGSVDLSFGGIVAPTTGTEASYPFLAATAATDIFDPTEVTINYQTRWESATQDAVGFTGWLGAGLDVANPVPGLGSPDGAFQLQFATPPTLPTTLPSGSPYHVAAAITPNGLNEALDAATRTGFIRAQGTVLTEVDLGNGIPTKLTAGVLRFLIPEFGSYPNAEKFRVVIAPSALAPVVSGRRGPGGEALDVQIPQASIQFLDESDAVALGLRVDASVGVDVGLGTGGTGSLTATAKTISFLGMALVENPIGADPAVVFEKLLCAGLDDEELEQQFACAISGVLTHGLDKVIGTIELPSLAKQTGDEDGFALAPKCLERLTDGTLVAEFGLLLPGETPIGGHAGGIFADLDCMPPVVIGGDFGDSGPGPVVVGPILTGGTAAGTFAADPGPSAPAIVTRAPIAGTTTATKLTP